MLQNSGEVSNIPTHWLSQMTVSNKLLRKQHQVAHHLYKLLKHESDTILNTTCIVCNTTYLVL